MAIKINGKSFEFENNQTILDLARKNGIYIPTLCYLKNVNNDSNCRICVVENMQNHRLMTACSTLCYDGLEIETESEKVVSSRKKTLQMMLSVHHKDCDNCQKNNNCDLQKLFDKYGICEDKLDGEKPQFEIDKTSPCIVRDNNKCILCGRCQKICANTQEVHALTKQKRGFNTFMGCAFNESMNKSTCVGCGQCTLVCPTGALIEHDETEEVLELLKNPNYFVTAQVAPSVRVSLAEAFGEKVGTFDENKLVSALKQIGFNMVFDVNLGADFTVVEESNELIERLKENKSLPLFSSCCPAWFKYIQEFYPNHTEHLSSCKSPTEMLGAIIKNYYAEKEHIKKENIKVIGIMPCTAKKGEKQRGRDVDYSLTTRELASMIKKLGIDYSKLPPQKFDSPLSYYSGAGLIFGATGGVTEAVLRTAMEKLGHNAKQIEFENIRHSNGRKEVEVSCGEQKLSLCIVNGLANAKSVMDDIVFNKKHYDFVEVMACPGGCVNGGGQNYVDYSKIDIEDVKLLRANSLYAKDREMKDRMSHNNPSLKQIYQDFFIPSPNKAKELLHYKH